MGPTVKHLVRSLIAASLVFTCLADSHADGVRLYREGAIPDPTVVASILGKPKLRMRGVMADAPLVKDGGETLSEDQINKNAGSAVSSWREHLAAGSGAGDAAGHVHGPILASNAAVPESTGESPVHPPKATTLALLVRFGNGSAQVTQDATAPLDAIAAGLKLAGLERPIVVEGHANATGSASVNQRLSQARADAVRQYLIEKGGIPANLLTAVGYGTGRPLGGHRPDAPENRRVEFRPADA